MLVNYDYNTSNEKVISSQTGRNSDMLMDITVKKMSAGEKYTTNDAVNEVAILLISGTVTYEYQGNSHRASRSNCFDEKPFCLHIPATVAATVTAQTDSEIIIQATENSKYFEPVFYTQEDCRQETFGGDNWEGTAKRQVITVFDYNNAPYSNLVIGEVINLPGRWSSYIPHSHPQPEVYYYKFDKPQGFGASFIGDDAYKILDSTASIIPGGLTHPQVTAPGYKMYYCWMIRHLDNNPWTTREDDPAHMWLLENN